MLVLRWVKTDLELDNLGFEKLHTAVELGLHGLLHVGRKEPKLQGLLKATEKIVGHCV